MMGWTTKWAKGLAVPAMALALAMAPQAANAQFFGYWGYGTFRLGIYPEDVAGIVADEGMRLIGPPRLNGWVYIADAQDFRGVRHRLIIDGAYGEVLKVFTVRAIGPALRDEAPPRPRHIARAAPEPEPEVIPGIVPAPRAPRKTVAKPPKVAREAPVERRPLPPPAKSKPIAPAAPALPSPSAAAPEPAPSAPPAAAVTSAPVATPAPAVLAPAPLGDGAPAKPAAPASKDVPVAPLD